MLAIKALSWLLFYAVFLSLEWFIFLRFFCRSYRAEDLRRQRLHGGEIKSKNESGPFNTFYAIILAPIIEEFIFRLPVLNAHLEYGLVCGLFTAVIMGVVFGLVHLTNITRYSDGVELKLSWSAIHNISIHGILEGILVIITGSLLPAIIAHSLWNASVLVVNPKKALAIAKKLNR